MCLTQEAVGCLQDSLKLAKCLFKSRTAQKIWYLIPTPNSSFPTKSGDGFQEGDERERYSVLPRIKNKVIF